MPAGCASYLPLMVLLAFAVIHSLPSSSPFASFDVLIATAYHLAPTISVTSFVAIAHHPSGLSPQPSPPPAPPYIGAAFGQCRGILMII